MPVSDPSTSTNEGAKTTPCSLPCSPKKLHRKDRSVTASQFGGEPYRTRSISGYRSRLRLLPPNQNSRLWMPQNPNPPDVVRLERRFRFSNRGTGGTTWGVDRAYRARRVEHLPADRRMVNPWNKDRDRDWSRFQLPESKSTSSRNSKLQRRTTAQDRVFPVYNQILLASNNDPTTPADFEPPSPPTLAQPGYHKFQTKVLKHARVELMKEARKAGYNDLALEG